MTASRRQRVRGGFTAKELLVVIAIVATLALLLGALAASRQVRYGRQACGNGQAQLVQSMRIYSEAEQSGWPSPWVNTSYHYGRARDAEEALHVTVRSFEVLAAVQSLPNGLFACPAAPEERPVGVPSLAAGAGPRWGEGPGARVSYAFDWACPADPSSARVVLADRDPHRHWRAVVACFGDSHVRTLPLAGAPPPWDRLRTAAGPQRTVDAIAYNPDIGPEDDFDDIYSANRDEQEDAGLREGFGDPRSTWVK